VKKCFLIVLFALVAVCSEQRLQAVEAARVEITGTVEDFCKGCYIIDLVGGGAITWDMLKVRVASPADFSGRVVALHVLLEPDRSAQRSIYSVGNRITFSTSEVAFNSEHVELHASDIHAG
jgi:hypothetical protein